MLFLFQTSRKWACKKAEHEAAKQAKKAEREATKQRATDVSILAYTVKCMCILRF
jgi:hypothetical protein